MRRSAGLIATAAALILLAVSLGLWYLLAPASLERVYGEITLAVIAATAEEVPTVRLDGEGGMAALDRCTGGFVEITSYRAVAIPPVHAAHNSCGGAQILNWELGQLIRIEGREGLYRAVDERWTRKWEQAETLVGIQGELVLQTCRYGVNSMRFLGFELVQKPYEKLPGTLTLP